MRQYNFEELKARASRSAIRVAETMSREDKVRRKPRDPVEDEILRELVVQRVQRARETGELRKVGGKLEIRL